MALGNRRRNHFVRATAIIYFQKYPGTNRSAGIKGLKFVVKIGDEVSQVGTTDSRGRASLFFDRTKTAHLTIMGMTYKIKVRAALGNFNGYFGMQERLTMLGYNPGPIDGEVVTVACDRAILNFQADTSGMKMDGEPVRRTQRKIQRKVGE